jgi:Tannase and feruloyl esterase
MTKLFAAMLLCGAVTGAASGQNTAAAPSCESLAQLTLSGAKISSATPVAAGAFTPPEGPTPNMPLEAGLTKALPAFCRILAQAVPSADSSIQIEVWMPLSGWNGKFQAAGNGGFAGEIDYRQMGVALRDNYATAGTDTGHSGSPVDASWALGHPEKIIDFGHRGIHEMTRVAKAVIKAFYGGNPQHSYFGACSNGGRQALMEAQRYPEDYDGILAGAPANFWTHLLSSALWDAQATTSDRASYIPASKLPALANAVNSACDAQDGLADGILNDPRQCHFDPSAMLCKEGDSDTCLTSAQVTALKKLYQGAYDSRGRQIFPGFLPGGETGPGGWGLWIIGPEPGKGLLFAFNFGFFSSMVYEEPAWDYKGANLDQAVKAADDKMARLLNATDTNLRPFKAHGGKLILYHGWNDAAISAINTINYYNGVARALGAQNRDSFVRLYMAPGVQHCAGGPGADDFGQPGMLRAKGPNENIQDALEHWVEKGAAPSTIIAAKRTSDDSAADTKMTRPLCPYPHVAKYKGAGDPNDAANFACAAP